MKRSFLSVILITMLAMSLMVGCAADDETLGSGSSECAAYVNAAMACHPETFASLSDLTGDELVAAIATYCDTMMAADVGDADGDETSAHPEFCCAKYADECNQFDACVVNPEACDNSDLVPQKCVEDNCLGASMCNSTDEWAACEVLCTTDEGNSNYYNEDCPGSDEFMTLKEGACETVACDNDQDCENLGNCDDPDKSSTKAFKCNDDSFCVRDI